MTEVRDPRSAQVLAPVEAQRPSGPLVDVPLRAPCAADGVPLGGCGRVSQPGWLATHRAVRVLDRSAD